MGQEREKKILVPNFVHTWPVQENSEKNSKKSQKNPFPVLFLAKTGWDRPRKREKNFSLEFRSSRPEQENFEKNSKKIEKFKKPFSDIIFSQNGMR